MFNLGYKSFYTQSEAESNRDENKSKIECGLEFDPNSLNAH